MSDVPDDCNAEPTIDRPPDKSQRELIALLTTEQLQQIDQTLVDNCAAHWRKVARIVGATMTALGDSRIQGIPDTFYTERIIRLVEAGRLLADGDLRYMGRSEVRLPSPGTPDPPLAEI